METEKFNYYEVLEVSPHCPQHEVTTAYERAKQTYSGSNPAIYTIFSQEEARDLLKLVEEAYSVLGNKTLRALYDEKIGQANVKKEDVSFHTLTTQSKTLFPEPPKKPTSTKPEYSIDPKMEEQIRANDQWNGEWLKKIRDYKQLPLERVSEITKISAFYIHSIENMEPKNLPAAVFVRGYVAQLAKVLGLDEKKVSDSYMKFFKESVEKK